MKKCLFIVLLVSIAFCQNKPWDMDGLTNSSKRLLFTNYYLGNPQHYQTLDDDVREIIDTELNIIFNNTSQLLQNLYQYQIEKTEIKIGMPIFDYQGWVNMYVMKGYRKESDEAKVLKYYFYKATTHSEKIIENRKITLFQNGYTINAKPSEIEINIMQPKWKEVVSKYGYSSLGEKGISKSQINKFKITNRYYEVEFIDQKRCILSSKYFGDAIGFDFFNLQEDISVLHYGTYKIEKVNWNILSGKNIPELTVEIDGQIINLNLFKIEPQSEIAIKKVFKQYIKIINDMLYDLVGEELEQKAKKDQDIFLKRFKNAREDALVIDNILLKLKQNFIDENFNFIENHIKERKGKVKHKNKKNGINIKVKSTSGRFATLFEENQLYSRQKDQGLTGHVFHFKNVKPNTRYLLLIEGMKFAIERIHTLNEDLNIRDIWNFKSISDLKKEWALKNWKPFSPKWKLYYPSVMNIINNESNFSQLQNMSQEYYGKLLGHLLLIEECKERISTSERYKYKQSGIEIDISCLNFPKKISLSHIESRINFFK